MGRALRRREARFLQGREVLLLPGLVGRLRSGPQHYQSRQVERAAKKLSVGGPDRLRRCLGVGSRQVRLQQSGRTQTTDVARRATARVSAGCHGSVLYGRARYLRGFIEHESTLQKIVRQPGGVPRRFAGVAPGGRTLVRWLYDPNARTRMTARRRRQTAPSDVIAAWPAGRSRAAAGESRVGEFRSGSWTDRSVLLSPCSA